MSSLEVEAAVADVGVEDGPHPPVHDDSNSSSGSSSSSSDDEEGSGSGSDSDSGSGSGSEESSSSEEEEEQPARRLPIRGIRRGPTKIQLGKLGAVGKQPTKFSLGLQLTKLKEGDSANTKSASPLSLNFRIE